MGLNLVSFFNEKITKHQKLAFVSTFIAMLLVHLYMFTNGFWGRDSLLNYYADQNILGSGRWALSVSCAFSSYFNLPWAIGLICCAAVGLTAVAVVSVLRIENPVLILLTGGLLAATPTVTETLTFLFTADGYFIAMALAAAAVYFSRIEEKRLSFTFLSAACICVSCGIYQAYLSLSLILAVCYFMTELFLNRFDKKEYLLWIGKQAVIFISALAAYYIIWQLCMKIQDVEPNDYQGIAEVGQVSLDLLKNGLKSSIRTFKWYFAPWSVPVYGFTPYIALNLIFVLFFLASVCLALWKSKIWQRPWALGLVILCLISIVPFSSIWHFTSDSIYYRTMMLPGMPILFLFAALNFEHWGKLWLKNLYGIVLLAVVLNYGVMANIVYYHMDLAEQRTYIEGIEMASRIRTLQKEHDVDRYAIIGQRYAKMMLRGHNPEYGNTNEVGQIEIFANTLDRNLLIESVRIFEFLDKIASLDMEYVWHTEIQDQCMESEVFQEMPCWPEIGSIGIIDDTIVVKISDTP